MPDPKPCPSCGHCPTCGRGGYHTVPFYQPYPYWPYVPYVQPYISWMLAPQTTGTVTVGGTDTPVTSTTFSLNS